MIGLTKSGFVDVRTTMRGRKEIGEKTKTK